MRRDAAVLWSGTYAGINSVTGAWAGLGGHFGLSFTSTSCTTLFCLICSGNRVPVESVIKLINNVAFRSLGESLLSAATTIKGCNQVRTYSSPHKREQKKQKIKYETEGYTLKIFFFSLKKKKKEIQPIQSERLNIRSLLFTQTEDGGMGVGVEGEEHGGKKAKRGHSARLRKGGNSKRAWNSSSRIFSFQLSGARISCNYPVIGWRGY